MKRVLLVVGTRPEAIKLAPLVRAALRADDLALPLTWTGQHAELLTPHAAALGVAPPTGPARGAATATLQRQVQAGIDEHRPAAVLAQGDTDSALAAAEQAHRVGIPFVHLEAGLRSGSVLHPWPEESNRLRIAQLATLHLAPTPRAAGNLLTEGVDPAHVVVTGNTIVDAVEHTLASLGADAPSERMRGFSGDRPRLLFTHHRRESVPHGVAAVGRAIEAVARAHPRLQVVMPTHPNPALAGLSAALRGVPNVHQLPALRHPELLWLLRRCRFAITDSGGIQEEAPSVGVPVLVTRKATERPEALAHGWAELVGWDPAHIEARARAWLEDDAALDRARPRCNPFGDGRAAPRCVQALRCLLGLSTQPPAAWTGPAIAA